MQVGVAIGVVVLSSCLKLPMIIPIDATVLGVTANVTMDVLIASIPFGSCSYPVCVVLKQMVKQKVNKNTIRIQLGQHIIVMFASNCKYCGRAHCQALVTVRILEDSCGGDGDTNPLAGRYYGF